MIKKLFVTIMLSITYLHASSINIAVASNVSYAIDDLKKEFKKNNPNTDVRVTLGSSGKLTAQIKHGAPYQLFMSANMKYPKALYEDKIAITKPVIYTQGALALLSSKKQNFAQGMKVLESSTIDKIAIANPKTAPYGKAAFEAIQKSGVYENIKTKFVYGESLSQTVTYTVRAADIGLIAKSSLYSPKMKHFKEGIHWIDVDSKLYTPIKQGLVILKQGENNSEVKAFYDFLLGEKAKKIMKSFGYLVP